MEALARLVAVALTALLVAAAPAAARPGDVDDTFGLGGQATFTTQGQYGDSRGLALQPDGKLVVGLSGGLARFDADGSLDRSFGTGGVTGAGLHFTPGQPIAREDGKIVVAGRVNTGQYSDVAAAARLLPNGAFDPSFGTAGIARVPGGGQSSEAWGAFEQSDGKLVLLTLASDPPTEGSGPAGTTRARLARLMPDGSSDQSFGKDGWVTLEVPDSSGLIYFGLEQDGKLIVGGEFDRRSTPEPDFEATIFRLLPDGSLDKTFGKDGISQGFFSEQGGVLGDLDVQPDGKLLIAGGARIGDGTTTGFVIGRANRDGSLDSTFGDGGRVAVRPPDAAPTPLHLSADQIVVQPDGRIVAAGNQSRPGLPNQLLSGWALARFLPDGTLDPEFGDGGWSTMASGLGNRLWPSGLVRTDDGKLVVSGDASECGATAVTLVRFHAEEIGDAGSGPVMRTCDPVVEQEPDGDLSIEVQCPLTEDVCRGTSVVDIPAAHVEVGRRSFKLRGAREGTIRIRASRRARRYIARPRGVRAEIVYTTKDGEGHRRITRRKLRLKRAG